MTTSILAQPQQASQLESELGTAQSQLVDFILLVPKHLNVKRKLQNLQVGEC